MYAAAPAESQITRCRDHEIFLFMPSTSPSHLFVFIDGIESLAQFLLGFEELNLESRNSLTEELDLISLRLQFQCELVVFKV